ncbi:MAG: tRNA (guanosine(37)-N1)-methyltransferase TrmD [Candidatus Moraniibacteriota bacterium]
MKFNIITIFPKIFDSYFNESILSRAQKENLIEIKIHNLRDYATDKHQTVDDTPYGGGAGMVLKIEPIWRCVQNVLGVQNVEIDKSKELIEPVGETSESIQQAKRYNKQSDITSRVILFSAKGKKYTQADAQRLAKYENIIMICGRYEGVDERVAENIIDEEFSIGEYVLTGGEIPAMILVDSVSRLLPGVLGNSESLKDESFNNSSQLSVDSSQVKEENSKLKIKNSKFSREYPHYTKPEEFNGWKVPEVLLSGNHKEIEKWRKENAG